MKIEVATEPHSIQHSSLLKVQVSSQLMFCYCLCKLQKPIPQMPGLLHVRNITKEELARMDPEERKKPYVCESKSIYDKYQRKLN